MGKFVLSFVLGLALISTRGWATDAAPATDTASISGADGVKLSPVPIPINSDCSLIAMRGTMGYENSAFIFPQAFISVDKNGQKLMRILPSLTKPHTYLLRFGLYLPGDVDKAIAMEGDDATFIPHGCDLSRLRHYLKKANNGQDLTLTRVNIRNIKVTIDGLGTQWIGSPDTSVLHYQEMDHILTYEIPAADVAEFMQKFSNFGVPITLDIEFAGRLSDGGLRIDIDNKKIKQDLQMTLGANLSKVVAQATVSAAFSKVDWNKDVKIVSEQSSNTAMTDVAKNIIDTVIADLYKPDTSQAAAPTAQAGGSSDKPVTVAMVYNHFSSEEVTHMAIDNTGLSQNLVYSTSTNLHGTLGELGTTTVRLYSNSDSYDFPISILPSYEVRMTPLKRIYQRFSYADQIHYFDKADLIHSFERLSLFGIAALDPDRITDINTLEGSRAQAMMPRNRFLSDLVSWGVLGKMQLADIPLVKGISKTEVAQGQTGVNISFTEATKNDPISFDEVLKNLPGGDWTTTLANGGEYDRVEQGQVRLIAHRRLGFLRLANMDSHQCTKNETHGTESVCVPDAEEMPFTDFMSSSGVPDLSRRRFVPADQFKYAEHRLSQSMIDVQIQVIAPGADPSLNFRDIILQPTSRSAPIVVP